ncbi:hypothetical protein [uncultured Erythrobacter sp.]|uniref:hypothetical protein n=1 Tax=uncultured Erythrobacter sp. TaxID=263913 RepID=UPI0026193B63|nr:hypothetical protein [uncultured Erythrobacter sp.]
MARIGWLNAIKGAALLACLSLAVPAAAQFEITYPDEPPEEGQTLLEWARPPILDHTIPEPERSDVSTCGARHDFDLDRVAVTCWPVLRATQLWTLASFAQGEPSGDTRANQRQAIGYADQTLDFIGEPRWPLQEHLRSKALETKLSALVKLEDWNAALETARALIANIDGDLMLHDDFRKGFAHRRYGDILLQLGRSEEARADLEIARQLLDGSDADKAGWPISTYSENVIADATRKGDLTYAEQAVDRYLAKIRTFGKGWQFGIDDHRDLKLYLLAARGDAQSALTLLDERFADEESNNRCKDGQFKFPMVLAPLRDTPGIVERLRAGGCRVVDIAGLETAAKWGIRDRSGEILLPYPEAGWSDF